MIARWKNGALRHLAARYRGQKLGLYGGSFNPTHEGHIYVAREALKRLQLDEIWFLVSPGNPLKSTDEMAPFEDRFAYLSSCVSTYPRMRASDIETRLGTRYTADTVTALGRELPGTKFVWIMGADNLASFDRWYQWETIARSLPIAVFDRSGYALGGFASGLARRFSDFRKSPRRFNTTQKPNWTFVTLPRHPASATAIRDQQGMDWFQKRKGKDT